VTTTTDFADTPVLNPDLQAIDRSYAVVGINSPREMSPHLLDESTTIVLLDIIRCTTTLTAALAAGTSALHVRVKTDTDDTTEDLAADHAALHGDAPYVLAGEKHGKPIPGGLFANSVLDVPADLTGVVTYFFSTNLGRAYANVTTSVLASGHTGTPVLIGSMANLPALADQINELGRARLLIVCGGFYDRLSLEDAVGAGRLIEQLGRSEDDLDDGAQAMAALADRYRHDDHLIRALHHNRIGKGLTHYGRSADIPAAITGAGVTPMLWSAMTGTVGRLTWIGSEPAITVPSPLQGTPRTPSP
jgi:2-phosphosulfolactate phosphatase